MAFKTTVPVRFGDVDKAGIVYYPVIFHYMHIAQEDFFRDFVGIPYHRVIEEDRIGFPTVSVQTDFFRPLNYGDDLEITVVISGVGRSSVTFEFSISRDGLSETLVKSSVKKVALNLDTWQRIDIPEKYREAFVKCGAD